MIGVALKGLLGRKLRATLTGVRNRARRRDDQRRIHPHRHARQELRRGLRGARTSATDAVISSKVAIKTTDGETETAAVRPAILSKVQALPASRVAQGSIEDEVRLVDEEGQADRQGRRAAVRSASTPAADAEPEPAQARRRARGRRARRPDRNRHGSTADKQLHGRPDRSARTRGGPARDSTGSAASSASARRLARQRHNLRVRPRDGRSGCSTSSGKLDLIRVGAGDGVSDGRARHARSEPLLSDHHAGEDCRGRRPAADSRRRRQEGMNVIKYFLLGFGGIALFVGSFVIANTLAITVAQRMRELATLRTLGATRRQVLGSVVLESLVVGIVGSVIGLFLGLGIAVGLTSHPRGDRHRLPSADSCSRPRTIVVSLAVGTLIALLGEPAAGGPRHAGRADRRRPRGRGRCRASRFARYALPVAGDRRRRRDRAASPTASFAGGLDDHGAARRARRRRAVPVRRRRDDRDAGRPPARLRARRARRPPRRQPGRLARQNAVRNPARTASTAAAVMIGLALITFVAVIGQGFKTSFTSAVDELFVGRLLRVGRTTTAGCSRTRPAEPSAKAPGVEAVSQIGRARPRWAARPSSSPASTRT